jgi:hypothetical protein
MTISLRRLNTSYHSGPDDLAEEDQFLLECNFNNITSTSREAQGTGCWGYKQPERRRAYGARDGAKHRADHGNARDGHEK